MALVSAIGCETIEQQSASGQVRALSDAENVKSNTDIRCRRCIRQQSSQFHSRWQRTHVVPAGLRRIENAQAQRGMEKIIEHYIALALKAANRFDTQQLERYLIEDAKLIRPIRR